MQLGIERAAGEMGEARGGRGLRVLLLDPARAVARDRRRLRVEQRRLRRLAQGFEQFGAQRVVRAGKDGGEVLRRAESHVQAHDVRRSRALDKRLAGGGMEAPREALDVLALRHGAEPENGWAVACPERRGALALSRCVGLKAPLLASGLAEIVEVARGGPPLGLRALRMDLGDGEHRGSTKQGVEFRRRVRDTTSGAATSLDRLVESPSKEQLQAFAGRGPG